VIHVASWAARFLFTSDQLDQPVNKLSGGERARVLIANLMLEPADLLLLDEPTNDLDIPTLEILEESLLEFKGALVLVTHDRYLLDRVSTIVLGLDGGGKAGRFADYSQWASDQTARQQVRPKVVAQRAPAATPKKKLSYLESREYESIEQRIGVLEDALHAKHMSVEEVALKEPRLLEQLYKEIEASQQEVDRLYARWAELEEKAG
jgi:ABC transport system ATP-binding/permease protein